jgi:hypothetical protein
MSIIFILIETKFDIDINNDKMLETIWEHKKRKEKKRKLIVTGKCTTT